MKRVALLIETSRTYGRDLLRGVKQYNESHGGWSLFVEVRDLESRVPPWLSNWDGDGILSRAGSPRIYQAVKKVGVPMVELRASGQIDPNVPFVGVDNQVAGRQVAEYFLERGFKNFGVYELDTESFFVERRDSFVATLAEAGYECSAFLQKGHSEKPSQWERQQQQLIDWVQTLPQPAAVLACTDQLGCWLLDACHRAGVHVPEQIAVVGVENDETFATMSTPPLSSLMLPGVAVGYAAAELLDAMMEGKATSTAPILVPSHGVCTRLSSDVLAVDDPLIADALRMIRQEACSGLRVDEILSRIPVSRSYLERGIRALLHRSPHAEILRVRLQRVSDLLADTDLTLDEIARRTGFATAQYLSESFKKDRKITPGQYRRRCRVGQI